jgi:hypothetical protein
MLSDRLNEEHLEHARILCLHVHATLSLAQTGQREGGRERGEGDKDRGGERERGREGERERGREGEREREM